METPGPIDGSPLVVVDRPVPEPGPRQIRSVTANTRADDEEFLALAERLSLTVTTQPYPMSEADHALLDLAQDRVAGAAVLLA